MNAKVYRVKNPTVQAIQFDGTNSSEVIEFFSKSYPDVKTEVKSKYIVLRTLYSSIPIEKGDYLVRDADGEFEQVLEYDFEEKFIEGGYNEPIEELTEAIRLTVEYVGNDTLPAIEGWSWYDALVKYAPEKADYFVKNPIRLTNEDENEDSNLVQHARREMELVGEDKDVIDWMVRTVSAYASYGHSGGSHYGLLPILYQLLNFKPLSPITSDPAEWIYHDEEKSGQPGGLWQNLRDPEVFSTDEGKTHYILGEKNFSDEHVTFPSVKKNNN